MRINDWCYLRWLLVLYITTLTVNINLLMIVFDALFLLFIQRFIQCFIQCFIQWVYNLKHLIIWDIRYSFEFRWSWSILIINGFVVVLSSSSLEAIIAAWYHDLITYPKVHTSKKSFGGSLSCFCCWWS